MGNCSAITDVYINPNTFTTYGEAMQLFGMSNKIDGFTYYEYPDGVLFNLERITKLPGNLVEEYQHKPKQNTNIDLDPNIIYLSYKFSR
jgi:hypothetical protein